MAFLFVAFFSVLRYNCIVSKKQPPVAANRIIPEVGIYMDGVDLRREIVSVMLGGGAVLSCKGFRIAALAA